MENIRSDKRFGEERVCITFYDLESHPLGTTAHSFFFFSHKLMCINTLYMLLNPVCFKQALMLHSIHKHVVEKGTSVTTKSF